MNYHGVKCHGQYIPHMALRILLVKTKGNTVLFDDFEDKFKVYRCELFDFTPEQNVVNDNFTTKD